MNVIQAAENLGKRVVLTDAVDGYARGRTGVLVSIQAGREPGSSGPYATVNFRLDDWSDEQTVSLDSLRPMAS